uniref:Reverse transcriptase domain-containing protein n=1 Tax=Lactuca sativa TaxID=4236 RepID=A0A9R1V720_LACSA|nr:hypothetical protein LSAT_V11C600325610 [Lactuca sativa]
MINASSDNTIMMQDSEDAWRFFEQLSHGSKTNDSDKKRDNPVSSVASVGLDKNWKNEVKSDINSLNKKFDLLLSSLGKEKADTNSKSIAAIEKQITQLVEQIGKREDAKFPNTTTVNPSHTQRPGKEHQVNEVIMLHSGKKVDNKISAPTLDNDSDIEVIFDEKEEFEKDFNLKKVSKVKLIKEVPSYAKLLKDLCVQKCKLESNHPKKIDLTEHASSILSNKLPPKLKDPGAPLIFVTLGVMDISFGNKKLRINIFNTFPNSPSAYECYRVDVVDDLVHQFTPKILHSDPLELFLSNDRDEVLDLEDIKMVEEAFENAIEKERPPWSHQVEKLPTSFSDPLKPSLEEPPTLELKTLPSHLKYSFLGSNENLLIIISSDFTGVG